MLHDAKTCHFQTGFQVFQRAADALKKQVQEEATRRVGKRLEYVVVGHGETIGDHTVTCQGEVRKNVGGRPTLWAGRFAERPWDARGSAAKLLVVRPHGQFITFRVEE